MRTVLLTCLVAATLGICAETKPASPPEKPKKLNITISLETTYLLGPLNDDGTVNYCAALNAMLGKGVTKENNAAIPLIQALGPEALGEKTREKLLRALDMTSLKKEGDYFVSMSDYVKQADPEASFEEQTQLTDRLEANAEQAAGGPFAARDYPDLVKWLQVNAQPFELAIAASKRPEYFVPWVSELDPPSMAASDSLMRFQLALPIRLCLGLQARAMLKAGAGEIDAALEDLQAARRLARHIARGRILIDSVVASEIDFEALESMAGLLRAGTLTAQQRRKLLAAVRAQPPLPDLGQIYDRGERSFCLDSIMLVARDGPATICRPFADLHQEEEVAIPQVDLDIDLLLRLANAYISERVAAAAAPTYRRRLSAFTTMEAVQDEDAAAVRKEQDCASPTLNGLRILIQRVSTKDRTKLTRAIWVYWRGNGSPAWVAKRLERNRVKMAVIEAALALEAFRDDRGHYPAALTALAPRYMKAVPSDAFADGPFKYGRTKSGFYLYSIGPNEKDDGGTSDLASRKDDIAVRVQR